VLWLALPLHWHEDADGGAIHEDHNGLEVALHAESKLRRRYGATEIIHVIGIQYDSGGCGVSARSSSRLELRKPELVFQGSRQIALE
jgi:hypothetical protein